MAQALGADAFSANLAVLILAAAFFSGTCFFALLTSADGVHPVASAPLASFLGILATMAALMIGDSWPSLIFTALFSYHFLLVVILAVEDYIGIRRLYVLLAVLLGFVSICGALVLGGFAGIVVAVGGIAFLAALAYLGKGCALRPSAAVAAVRTN